MFKLFKYISLQFSWWHIHVYETEITCSQLKIKFHRRFWTTMISSAISIYHSEYKRVIMPSKQFFSYIYASYIRWDDVCFVLAQHSLILSASSLKQQWVVRQVAPLTYCSLILAACSAEKQQIQILVFGLTWQDLQCMIYSTWGKHIIKWSLQFTV